MHSNSNAAVLSAKKRNTNSQISGTNWIHQTPESSVNSKSSLGCLVLGGSSLSESPLPCSRTCCLFDESEYPLKPREDVLSLSDCTVQYTPDDSSMYWTVTVFPRTPFSIQVYSPTLLYLPRNSASNSFFSIVSFLRSVLGRKSYLLPYKSAQYLANCQTHSRDIYSSSWNNGLLSIPSAFSGDIFLRRTRHSVSVLFLLAVLKDLTLKFFSSQD